MIGNGKGVGNVFSLYGCTKGRNINGSVDVHSRILHTGVGRVLNGKAGGFDWRVVKVQLGL